MSDMTTADVQVTGSDEETAAAYETQTSDRAAYHSDYLRAARMVQSMRRSRLGCPVKSPAAQSVVDSLAVVLADIFEADSTAHPSGNPKQAFSRAFFLKSVGVQVPGTDGETAESVE